MAQIIIVDYVKNDAQVYRVHMKNEYGDIVQKSKVLADFDKTLGYLNAMAKIWASNGRDISCTWYRADRILYQ